MNDNLADAVRDFLSALDKGYFDSRLTTGGVESAFVKDLRKQLAIQEAQSEHQTFADRLMSRERRAG